MFEAASPQMSRPRPRYESTLWPEGTCFRFRGIARLWTRSMQLAGQKQRAHGHVQAQLGQADLGCEVGLIIQGATW